MGRRSDHTREELKEMFIQAGQDLVREEGHQALNARGVAARIGYSVGTLYNVFNNLSDLVVHINARTLDGLRQAILNAQEEHRNAGRQGNVLGRTYLQYARENMPLWRLMYEYQFPEGEAPAAWWKEKVESLFSLVEESLSPYFGGPGRDLRRASRVIWAGLHGISMLSLAGRISASSEHDEQELCQALYEYCILGHRELIQLREKGITPQEAVEKNLRADG